MPDRLPENSNLVAFGTLVVEEKPPRSLFEAASSQRDENACEVVGIRKLQGSLIGRVWPGERIVVGMRTCRWLRQELRENAETIVLRGRRQYCDHVGHEFALRRDICQFQNPAAAVELHSLSACLHLDGILSAVISAGWRRSPSVVSLDMRQCRMTWAVAQQTAKVLALHSRLSSLNLSSIDIAVPREPVLRLLRDGFQRSRALTHLDLSRNCLGDAAGLQAMLAALSRHSSLSELHLHENNLCDGQHVANALGENGKCKLLAMSGNQLGSAGAASLAQALQHCSRLEHLDLGANNIGSSGAAAVAGSVRRGGCGALAVLRLAGNDIGDEGMEAVSELLRGSARLRTLDLSCNRVGGEGLELVMEGLRASGGGLKRLELRENRIGEEAAVVVCALLGSCSALGHLDLSGNALQPPRSSNQPEREAGAPRLAAARGAVKSLHGVEVYSSPAKVGGPEREPAPIPEYTTLTRLELGSCGLGAEGVGQLGVVLLRCKALQRVNLRGNRLGPMGARALADGLRACKSLRSLDLTGCKVGGAGMELLAGALAGCDHLESLWLGRNEATNKGVEGLSAGLVGWPRLTELNLRENKVGARGAIALGRGLRGCGGLRTLDLARNELGRVGAEQLATGLGSCSALTHLVLRYNDMGAEGALVVAEGVRGRCEGLKHLDLRSNEVGKEGAERVVETLRGETALTCLDLRCNNKGWF